MAKVKKQTEASKLYKAKPKVRRPGVHAKTKSSNIKGSKLYVKKSVGQGK